ELALRRDRVLHLDARLLREERRGQLRDVLHERVVDDRNRERLLRIAARPPAAGPDGANECCRENQQRERRQRALRQGANAPSFSSFLVAESVRSARPFALPRWAGVEPRRPYKWSELHRAPPRAVGSVRRP